MLKTHKPRGHQWTNASLFQQTKDYRNIEYNDGTAYSTRVLAGGTDETLSAAARKAKRRRIEKLADDFMNGKSLDIVSARPGPRQLRTTVSWNKKSSSEPKFVLPAVERPPETDSVWEDVEDESEILSKARKGTSRVKDHDLSESVPHDAIQGVSEETAQADGAKVRRTKSFQLNLGPSEEALRIAAALRMRRIQKGQAEARSAPSSVSKAQKTPNLRIRAEPEPGEASEDRLLRRQSYTTGLEHDDESLDELRLSRIETPTRQLRSLDQVITPDSRSPGKNITDSAARRIDQVAQNGSSIIQETVIPDLDYQEEEINGGEKCTDRMPRTPVFLSASNLQSSSFRAIENLEILSTDVPTSIRSAPQPSRFTALSLLYTGIEVQPVKASAGSVILEGEASSANPVTPFADSREPVASGKRRFEGPRKYTTEQKASNGSTPFMYRRLESGSDFESSIATRSKPRRSARLQSLENDQAHPQSTGSRITQRKTTSKSHVSAPSTDAQSSPACPSICLEPEAGPPRSLSQPPTSLQLMQETGTEEHQTQAQSLLWPGTQVLLCQAQRELFTSPEKPDTGKADTPKSSPSPAGRTFSRKASKGPSQEQMPSTQQLLDAYEGFSTVKKPRGGYGRSLAETPTASDKRVRTEPSPESRKSNRDTGRPAKLHDKTNRRSSALRFSFSANTAEQSLLRDSFESSESGRTMPPMNLTCTELATPQNVPSTRSRLRSSTTAPSPDESLPTNPLAGPFDETTMEASTFLPEFSRFQPAQRELSMASDGEADRTIDGLTESILWIGDADDVMSQ
jgi:hypothetical protein